MASAEVSVGKVRAPVVPLLLTGLGAYLAWFGVKYWRQDVRWPSDPVKRVLQGKTIPAAQPPAPQSALLGAYNAQWFTLAGTVQPATGLGTGTATGQQIAAAALRYTGQGYVWGGPADKPGNWDCSSFASYVLGHDLGMKLPLGGAYGDPGFPPHAHGPNTSNYLFFGKPVPLGMEQPGDLLVTVEHMGFVIGGGKMISAQDPALGTGVASYQGGFPGGVPFVRRVATG